MLVTRVVSERVSPVVLITAADAVPWVQAQPGFEHDILVFAEADVFHALAAIVRHRPHVVALAREFVNTLCGAALINHIRTDPSLSHAQIRVLTDVSAYA